MKLKEFCKKHNLSKSSIIKYLEGKNISYITKKKLDNLKIKKEDFEDYEKEYQCWYINNNKNRFKELSKQSHISITSWIKYIKGWKISNQIKYKINKYIKENNININNIFNTESKEINLNEKEYHGKNYDIYSWNIDNNKRRIQIEIKNNKPLQSNKKELLNVIKNINNKIFADIQQNNIYGIITDIDKNDEKEIINIIDKTYL